MNNKIIDQMLEWRNGCSKEVKGFLIEKNVFLINVTGLPETGKTSLIIEAVKKLNHRYNFAVIEGDITGPVNAKKIDSLNVPVIQFNTGNTCQIQAESVKNVINYLDLDEIDIIFVENKGNTICPTEFNLGEDLKIAILSIPEGDDKIEKYPMVFSQINTLILNKYDTMEHHYFDEYKVECDSKKLNPEANIFKVSSRTGDGYNQLVKYIDEHVQNKFRKNIKKVFTK